MNPLDNHPALRQGFYYAQFIIAGVILLTGLGLTAAEVALPTWYVVASVVTQGAWSYLGLTAGQNVPSYRDVVEGDAPAPERGATSVVTVLLVVVLVLLILALLGVLR